MGIELLLDIAESTFAERVVIGSREPGAGGMTPQHLSAQAAAGAAIVAASGAKTLVFLGENGPVFPVAVLTAARAGIPIAPLNYRLSTEQLAELLARLDSPYVIADDAQASVVESLPGAGVTLRRTNEWSAEVDKLVEAGTADYPPGPDSDESPAVLLFTSGTTSAPKCVVLRHEHLLAYVLQTIDPGSADEDDAALVSVPAYHVAGTATVLTNLYAGRRVVYLPAFTPESWLDVVRTEGVSSAMVVPTMLARIVDHLDGMDAQTPRLRSLAYGGARLPLPVLERALLAFPTVDFANAYGLTETSSTIAVLGPADHRDAIASDDPAVRARLGSAGQFVTGVEGQIRDEAGTVQEPGVYGELFVRGPQISGEYVGLGSMLDENGWFPTKDRAMIDPDGYLFIEGRMDDTIIRGGENIAPAEIEDALLASPLVHEAAVIGRPDEEWGERIVAVVVPTTWPQEPDPDELRAFVRARLRGSKTPDQVIYRESLPHTETGKLLRRELHADLSAAADPNAG